MEPETPRYFWWLICSRGCTHERVSTEPISNPTWVSEKCPICGGQIMGYIRPPERAPRG